MVGDLERSRLTQVKFLFVLGVNDGYIPQTAKSGGIVSWLDREFLKESGITLSPTPREQMFIQKCYLYMNLTKPSLQLQISYARTNQEGKTLRPSYLIDELRRIFPGLTPQCPQADPKPAQIVGARQGLRYLANALREHAAGQSTSEVQTLYAAYGGEDTLKARTFLQDAAFRRYQDSSLPKAVAQALFSIQVGKTYLLENSVSRLETYAQCAYRHFLEYGLSLRERQEFHFDSLDMGNVFHEVLDRFSKELEKSDYTWFTFPEDYAREAIARILEFYAATYKETVLFDNARNTYAITRMGRILTRSVLTLQKQLKKGAFVPDAFELSFESLEVPSVKMRLSPDEAMNLRGRIDRVDIAGDDERVYVKVMDYKSGVHSFELAAVYVGLQLQLIVYMNAALEVWAKKNPDKDIVPAALLYYHIDDPTVESATPLTEEELERAILQKLRTSGVVSDDEEAIKRLDSTLSGKSDVIPVERKKDGAFSAASSVMSREELRIISTYVSEKVASLGRDILDGRITKDPIDTSTVFPAGSCQYCPYQSSCGFDPMIPGYRKREIVKSDKESLLESMAKVQVDEEAT
jgi:ATP-dependent helicase/nuclease subunit B